MTINNFEQIKNFIDFGPKDYYFLQIIKRRKENPDMRTGVQVIKSYFIDSLEKFERKMPQIIELCENNNARAYFSLNKRNFNNTAHHMINYVNGLIMSGQENAIHKAFELCTGKYAADKDKKWILDVDIKDRTIINSINKVLQKLKPEGNKIKIVLPTKNGFHIITSPFDPREYNKMHPDHEIHKDSPTILYIP